mgnify:FL=1
MIKFEFFFDCSSPWTYLAFSRIHSVIEKYNIEPIWKPILVGGVFNEVNKDIYAQRENPNPRKFKYSRKDMQDWAELANIKIMWPSIFPVNAVKMMRIAIVAEEENKLIEFANFCFKSYWEDDLNVGDEGILEKILIDCDMDPSKIFELIKSDKIKNKLRKNTENLIERGGFGSPTIFINDTDMYFGNDRIELVDFKLSKLKKNS